MVKSRFARVIRQWIDEALDAEEAATANGSPIDEETFTDDRNFIRDIVLPDAKTALRLNRQDTVSALADELIKTHQLAVERGSEEYKQLRHELLAGKVDLYAELLRRINGIYRARPASEETLMSPAVAPEAAPAAPSGPTVREALRDYMHEHRHRKSQARIQSDIIKFFASASLTPQSRTSEIIKTDVVRWKTSLMGKISPSSVAKKLVHLGHWCRWLKAHDHLPNDPTEGLLPSSRSQQAGKTKKQDFSREQLRQIVDALQARRTSGQKQPKHFEEYFWSVLCCLYGGLRNSEARCLWSDRLTVEDGIDMFDLKEDLTVRGVSIKTARGERRVPVHSGLKSLGFMEYVAKRRGQGGNKPVPLFPSIPDTTSVSRFFKLALLQPLGLDSKARTLHSARHSMSTILDESNVSEKVRFALLGWARQGIGNTVYGHTKVTAKELQEAIEKVQF
jgi:integrase